jgi:2-C-methyl-D-erythritol 4-phosphate cytidylyltransferase
MNVGIILAAGRSTRFDSTTPKQLYPIDGKPIVQHSIDLLSKHLDRVIVVTNSICKDHINGEVIVNDTDSRLKSIKAALDQIDTCDNILIHDAARPYIKDSMIGELITSSRHNLHSQFYLPLVNGLAKFTTFGYQIPNRNDYIELCSPQITKFDIFKYVFNNYIEKGEECEVLPLISRFEFRYNLIQGHYRYLRKITTLEDIF